MVLAKNMSISAIILGLFAVVGTTLVAMTYDQTAAQISENEREFLLRSLHVLITPDKHNNDMFSDSITVTHEDLGSSEPVNVYRARKAGKPVAAIINSVAPDGYNGRISLLVAIYYNGTLAGVRVVSHRETPGLGDAIEATRSDWILGFSNKSLSNPQQRGWAVKRDGGDFDQFTGATITPRAIVKAVYKTLKYFEAHRDDLFAEPTTLQTSE